MNPPLPLAFIEIVAASLESICGISQDLQRCNPCNTIIKQQKASVIHSIAMALPFNEPSIILGDLSSFHWKVR